MVFVSVSISIRFRVSSQFTIVILGFYWVLPSFRMFLLGLIRYYLVLNGLYWVVLGYTGFYWVLMGFTGFYWVLLGCIGFE